MGRVKTDTILIRVEPEVGQAIRAHCRARGELISGFLLRLALAEVEQETSPPARLAHSARVHARQWASLDCPQGEEGSHAWRGWIAWRGGLTDVPPSPEIERLRQVYLATARKATLPPPTEGGRG